MADAHLFSQLKLPLRATVVRARAFLRRRPHRSFRLTRRRDYVRSLQLPGYWRFTTEVLMTLWRHKRTFGILTVIYILLTVVLVGMTSQDAYTQTVGAIKQTGGEFVLGGLGGLEQASLVFLAAMSGTFNSSTSGTQQICAVLIILLVWLTTVWLLRAILAGQKPRLRDGVYSSGAPLVATFIVALILMVQLFPLALAAIGFSAANSTGLLNGGVEAMLFWAAAALLGALSLYWATSTFMALIIVTLPGMYPFAALKAAGDLVVGRRLRLLARLAWVIVGLLLTWAVVMIPLIMFDTWLKSVLPAIAWLPLVPIALLVLGSLSVVILAAYVYLLYRKVVEDDAAPATN